MEPQTGRVLDGRYRLGSLLGRGGMATVRAATDLRLRRTVAIKLFHDPTDDVVLSRLRVEAKLLAGLSHPGLVTVFDVSAESGRPYLVLQLISGCTLRAAIDRTGPRDPGIVTRLGLRLAETLRYVHSRQIMHRDLKPSNVLLDRDGRPYLADFGLAKAIGAAALTATGHCVGTAAYLAPEQVAGHQTGPPADIYSLGLVLLECLTGLPEYTGTEVEAAIARLSRAPRIPDSIPSALRTALTAMTARTAAARVDADGSVRLLRAALADLADRSAALPTVVLGPVPDPSTKVLPPVPAPARPRFLRRRTVHAAAAVVVAGGVAVGSILSGGGTGAPAPAAEPLAPPATVPSAVPPAAPRTASGDPVVAPVVPVESGARPEHKPLVPPGRTRGKGGGKSGRG